MPHVDFVPVRVQVSPSSWLAKIALTTMQMIVLGGPSRTTTQWTSETVTPSGSFSAVPSTRSHDSPRSRLRHSPPSSTPNQADLPSTASYVTVRMRGLLTPAQCSGRRGGSPSQVFPPAPVRCIPARDGRAGADQHAVRVPRVD